MDLSIHNNNFDSVPISNLPDSNDQESALNQLREQGFYVSSQTTEEEAQALLAQIEPSQEEVQQEEAPEPSVSSGKSSNVFALAAGVPIAEEPIPTISKTPILEPKTLEQRLEQQKILLEARKIQLAGSSEQQERANTILNDTSLSGEEKLNQLKDIIKEIPLNDDPQSPQRVLQQFIEDHPMMSQPLKDQLEYIMYIPDPALQTRALELANTIMDDTLDPLTKTVASSSLSTLLMNYQMKKALDGLR